MKELDSITYECLLQTEGVVIFPFTSDASASMYANRTAGCPLYFPHKGAGQRFDTYLTE